MKNGGRDETLSRKVGGGSLVFGELSSQESEGKDSEEVHSQLRLFSNLTQQGVGRAATRFPERSDMPFDMTCARRASLSDSEEALLTGKLTSR